MIENFVHMPSCLLITRFAKKRGQREDVRNQMVGKGNGVHGSGNDYTATVSGGVGRILKLHSLISLPSGIHDQSQQVCQQNEREDRGQADRT